MITSKQELKEYIQADNNWQQTNGLKNKFVSQLAAYPTYYIKKYLVFLRKQEYYINTAKGNKLKGLLAVYYEHRKNRLGVRLGIEIGPNCFGKGLMIYHAGNIVVNVSVRVGENCKLHGGNCIGNNGKTDIVPRLGNNVDVGYGAVIIGDVDVADNVVIGANAVVNRSIVDEGCVAAGVPAVVKMR